MIKIVTFNLRHDADRWVQRYPLVVQALIEQNADVIAFQEVALPIQQANVIADALNTVIGEPTYRVYVQPKWGDQGREGIAILSKIPAAEVTAIDLPEGGRVAQRIRVIHEGQPLNIVNTHLHHLPDKDESIRAPQMRAILAWMASAPSEDSWVLVGDFNAQPHTETIQSAAKTLQSAYWSIHGAEPLTFPTPLVTDNDEAYPSVAIDYVFFSPARLKVISAQLVGTRPADDDSSLYPSDHFGIAAELVFK